MNNKVDNRSVCNDAKKARIRASLLATAAKRQKQVLKTYELKIIEKRLNKLQKEQLQMLFVEGKWFYNHILGMHKEVKLKDINTTHVKEVKHFDKDGNELTSRLEYLSAA